MIEYNEVSIKFYSNGLDRKEEERRRNYYFMRGRYWDQVVVDITKQDNMDHLKRLTIGSRFYEFN